jgi:hypothetical protein
MAIVQYDDQQGDKGKGKFAGKGPAGKAAMALSSESLLMIAGRQSRLGRGKPKPKAALRPNAKGSAFSRTKAASSENFPDSMNRIISMGRGELREARVLTT